MLTLACKTISGRVVKVYGTEEEPLLLADDVVIWSGREYDCLSLTSEEGRILPHDGVLRLFLTTEGFRDIMTTVPPYIDDPLFGFFSGVMAYLSELRKDSPKNKPKSIPESKSEDTTKGDSTRDDNPKDDNPKVESTESTVLLDIIERDMLQRRIKRLEDELAELRAKPSDKVPVIEKATEGGAVRVFVHIVPTVPSHLVPTQSPTEPIIPPFLVHPTSQVSEASVPFYTSEGL